MRYHTLLVRPLLEVKTWPSWMQRTCTCVPAARLVTASASVVGPVYTRADDNPGDGRTVPIQSHRGELDGFVRVTKICVGGGGEEGSGSAGPPCTAKTRPATAAKDPIAAQIVAHLDPELLTESASRAADRRTLSVSDERHECPLADHLPDLTLIMRGSLVAPHRPSGWQHR